MALTGAQRKYLRGLAHGARPLVQIGKEGMSEAVVAATDDALASHELVKVQFLGVKERPAKAEIVVTLEQRLGAECVGTIGHMAIFFRANPDAEKRKVKLPEKRS